MWSLPLPLPKLLLLSSPGCNAFDDGEVEEGREIPAAAAVEARGDERSSIDAGLVLYADRSRDWAGDDDGGCKVGSMGDARKIRGATVEAVVKVIISRPRRSRWSTREVGVEEE